MRRRLRYGARRRFLSKHLLNNCLLYVIIDKLPKQNKYFFCISKTVCNETEGERSLGVVHSETWMVQNLLSPRQTFSTKFPSQPDRIRSHFGQLTKKSWNPLRQLPVIIFKEGSTKLCKIVY